MTSDDIKPSSSRGENLLASVVRATAGMVPVFGSILQEIVTYVIPNKRLDNFGAYLQKLDDKLNNISADLNNILMDVESIKLIEDGAIDAAHSYNPNRIKFIANCIAKGITGGQLEKIRAKRVLNAIERLDDEQIILVYAYSRPSSERSEIIRNIYGGMTSNLKADQNTLFEVGNDELVRSGLLSRQVDLTITPFGRIVVDQLEIHQVLNEN